MVMKLKNGTAMLRSACLFGGFMLTKSEIRKVKIVTRRQTPRCRAGYGWTVTETMGMYLTNCTPKCIWQQPTPSKTQENSKFSENNNNKVPSNKITAWLFISAQGFWLFSNIAAIHTCPAFWKWKEIIIIIWHQCEMPSLGKTKGPG